MWRHLPVLLYVVYLVARSLFGVMGYFACLLWVCSYFTGIPTNAPEDKGERLRSDSPSATFALANGVTAEPGTGIAATHPVPAMPQILLVIS